MSDSDDSDGYATKRSFAEAESESERSASSDDDDETLPKHRVKRVKQPHDGEEKKVTVQPPSKEIGGLDMRLTFPIDEEDETSRAVMGVLSYFMQKLNRTLTETEAMSYVYAWLVVCNSLNRITAEDYGSRNMNYTWGRLRCPCFRYEIIAHLHEVCYKTLQHGIDQIHDFMHNHNIRPVVLNAPPVYITPISTEKLMDMLRTQVEYCQLALRLVHAPWLDFTNAWPEKRSATDVTGASMAHTATLGVLCSFMLQTLFTLRVKPTDEKYNETLCCKWLWQSAIVFSAAQAVLPLAAKHKMREDLLRLGAQLQIAVYRKRVIQAGTGYAWGAAAWFTLKIIEVLGRESPQAAIEHQTLAAYLHQQAKNKAREYPLKDRVLVTDLDEYTRTLQPTNTAIQTMAPGMLSPIFGILTKKLGRLVPRHWPVVRLRYRSGQIVGPERLTTEQILKE